MARNVTLLQLRTQVRQRADMVNSSFITDAELNDYVNASVAWLYDLLIGAYGSDYYSTFTDISTVAGTESYALPATFYKLTGVDYVLSSTQRIPLKPFMMRERNREQYPFANYATNYTDYRYQLRGSNIFITPIPQGVVTLRLWYIPVAVVLTADGNTVDGVDGWEELIVIDSAIKCLQKEESDVSALSMEREKHISRIEIMAEDRDAGEPKRGVDVYSPSWRDW